MIHHSEPWITEKEKEVVARVLGSGMLSKGEWVAKFEKAHAEFLGKEFALATGSGTEAQILILKALGIGAGDEVILPSYVCDKVWKGVKATGATPVLCDIAGHWVMDTACIRKKMSAKTKAVILVHIFGIDAWEEEMATLGIPVIEDICQALGGQNKIFPGRHTGYAFNSFHGTKCISTGQGGMLIVGDEKFHAEIQKIKKETKFGEMSNLQAAIGWAQMSRYGEFLENRRRIAEFYFNALEKRLTRTTEKIKERSMFFRFPVFSDTEHASGRAAFESAGIAVRKGVDALIHRDLGLPVTGFENTEKTFEKTFSLPILPQMGEEQMKRVAEYANKILA